MNETKKKIENERLKYGWSMFNITVEPILFSTTFVFMLTNGVKTDFQQSLICQMVKGIPSKTCTSNLTSEEEGLVNAKTAQLEMASLIVNSLGPIVMALFIGPWSDINGRKPFLLAATAGMCLHFFLWGLMTLSNNMEPLLVLFLSIPVSATGGIMSIMICSYSYLGDAHSEMARPLRFAIGVGGMNLGSLAAGLSAAPIFSAASPYGYQAIFFLATSIVLLNLIYIVFQLPESIHLKPGRNRNFFNLSNVRDVAEVIYKRPCNEIFVVVLTISILIGEFAPSAGESTVAYLVGKSEYNWSLSKYNYFNVFTQLVGVLSAPILTLIFKKVLNMDDMWTICIFSVVDLLGNWMKACSVMEIQFWVAAAIVKLNSVTAPLIMSALSQIAPKDHLGRVYALVSLLESIAPIIFSSLYSSVYKSLVRTGATTVIVYMISTVVASYITVTTAIIQIIKAKFYNGQYDLDRLTREFELPKR